MGRKSKKGGGGSRKPPRPEGGAPPPPPPTNADWDDSTAAFRKEAESAIRARSDDGGVAAARLADRHPASPLAHHVLGDARATAARAGDAVPALRRAAELAPRCPGIAATLASALLYARRPGEALAECARALAVADPTDPALHAAASRRGGLMAPSPQARVAAARERLLGLRADAEALEAAGARHAAAPLPPVMAPTKMNCCCRHATKRSALTDDDLRRFLTVSFDDLTAHCDQTGAVHLLTRAVEFAKATKAWAYWLCPVCDNVFLDANSFMSHVEGEYIHELQELQPLMPKRATLDTEEIQYSLKWTSFDEMGEEDPDRRKVLDKIKEVFSCLNTFKALPVSLMDRVIKLARGRSKKPLPYCVPSCVTSLDSRELQRLVKPLEQLLNHLSRGWEFVRVLGNEGKSKGRSEIISLVQDGSLLLSLDAEQIVSRKKDGSCEKDAVFRWLLNSLEEVAMPWTSLRQKCVHHGNEVLERICEISDSLLRQSNLKCAAKEKNHRGYSLTEAESIDVEMLLLDNEVGYLKNKLVEVCTFDYSAAILPLIRAYIWVKLNSSPGEDLRNGVDKDAVDNGDGLDSLHGESLFEDKIPDTDSDMRFTFSRTDDCENSSLSQSDSSNYSTFETESFSVDCGVTTVLHITADDLQFLIVTLRALWHLREFHDRFLNMPLVLPHFTVEVHCIACLLGKVFNAWDNEKDYGVTTFPSDVRTAFSDILNERNLFGKEGVNIASEIVSTIFESLHKSHASLQSDNATFEHRAISTTRCLDYVCVAHNVFGLPIREQKKCNCLNESCEGKEHTTFFHSVDVSAIQAMEMKSLGQLLRDADKKMQYDSETCPCGNKNERSLQSAPPIFAIVFNWAVDKESHIDMSDVMMSITTPLQFDVLYEVLRREDYNLATAVCCVEEEHICFARKEGKWIIYGSKTIEFADSWESLLNQYRHRSLRPQILFFDSVRCRSIH
ncbi:hypothetical protein SETIT_8G174700v2 [Setaria italica]|uniref:DUF629 domain-containing protein n=1 Tax=Setaria italica TaxID=4555 RepID=K3ZLL3_SETIT|nr:hypothetical protein SETIT_8G174700v2 [Setaria italica]